MNNSHSIQLECEFFIVKPISECESVDAEYPTEGAYELIISISEEIRLNSFIAKTEMGNTVKISL